MKKKISILCLILCLSLITFFGCGVISLPAGPKYDDAVYGNGGFAVVKGDYLYFANAYIDYNNIGRYENKYAEDKEKELYNIYRAKLNDFGLIDLDSNGNPVGVELLVPQVGGFAYSGLYICGDYLYYATPKTEVDGNGKDVKGLVSFDRVKINGENHETVYNMTSYSSSCSYEIVYIDGVTYLTIFDTNSNLIVVKIQGGNIQKYDGDVNDFFAKNVVSYALYNQQNVKYNESLSQVNKYIYYVTKDGNYYNLYRKLLSNANSQAEPLITSSLSEIKVLEVKNDRLYYLEDGILTSSNFEQNSVKKQYSSFTIKTDAESNSTNEIVSYVIQKDTEGTAIDKGIIATYKDGDGNYVVASLNGSEKSTLFTKNSEKQVKLLFANGNNVYYKLGDETVLYKYNVLSREEIVVANSFNTSVSDESNNVFDFDTERVFYFNSVNGSSVKYLHMAQINQFGYTDSENNFIGHYIGKLTV